MLRDMNTRGTDSVAQFGVLGNVLLLVVFLLSTVGLIFSILTYSTIESYGRAHFDIAVTPQSQPDYDSPILPGNTTCDDSNQCTSDLVAVIQGQPQCIHNNLPTNTSCADTCMLAQTGKCLNGECHGVSKGFCPSPIDFSEEICPNVVLDPAIQDAVFNGTLYGKMCFYSKCFYFLEYPLVNDWTCPTNIDMEFIEDDEDCLSFLADSFPEKRCMSAGSLCLDTYDYGIRRVCVFSYTASSYELEAPMPSEPEPDPEPEPPTLINLPLQESAKLAKAAASDDTHEENSTTHNKTTAPARKHRKKEKPTTHDTPVKADTTAPDTKAKVLPNGADAIRDNYKKHLRDLAHTSRKSKRDVHQLGPSSDTLTINQVVISALGGDNLYDFIRINLYVSISQRINY